MMPESIFKSYDIRGVYPTEINEKNIGAIVKAIYRVFYEQIVGKGEKRQLTILVGRDMRLSGPSLYPILKDTLVECGAKIVDIDLASTPTMYFGAFNYGYDAGLQLSASHNPSQYAGLKMVIRDSKGLKKIGKGTGMEQIKAAALDQDGTDAFIKALNLPQGSVEQKSILADELHNAEKIESFKRIGKLKVVADGANAMGSQYIELLFNSLPCTLVKMNFELDGSFPSHQPNPLIKENVADLQKRVLLEKADVGLAPDGDGDRLFFVDEEGQIVPASIITALIARELLKKSPGGTILYDVRYTMTPKKIIAEFGGVSDITKVGHAFITAKMRETSAIFGGESSGHYFFKATGNAESQLPVIAIVLSVLSQEQKPLSQIAREIARSFESGEINFKSSVSGVILEDLKKTYSDGNISLLDGVSIEYPTWRFGVRTSNTEPLLRLNVEALTEKEMEQKRDELMGFIEKHGATPVSE